METEPDQRVPAQVTRRKVLETGAKLGGALLWTAPIIQSTGMVPAFAQGGSGGGCDQQHPGNVHAEGQACDSQDAALRDLEADADQDSDKFCKKIDMCRSGKCRFLSRGPLSNVTCKQVPDKHCSSGTRWKCVGFVTSITCQCR